MNIQEMKCLTDENIDVEILEFLRGQGFDVFDIKEERLFSMLDEDILAMAYKTNRVVVSQDSDFGTLIFRNTMDFYGVIYLRPGHVKPQIHIQSLNDIINAGIDYKSPFIVVAENLTTSVKIRYRSL